MLEMSYKVNFHVVGLALQNTMCLLVFEPQNEASLTGGQDLLDLENMSFSRHLLLSFHFLTTT